jgi:hypothetical protein
MLLNKRICTYIEQRGLAMPIDSPRESRTLKRFLSTPAILAAGIVVAVAAVSLTASGGEPSAVELRPIEAKSLRLGDMSGVAYYTVQGLGYRVVVTLARQGSAPVRFESTLLPGQEVAMSMPGGAGADARTVEFSRQGDHLLVAANPEPID